MRDARYADEYDDDDDYEPVRRRSALDTVESLLLIGALALIATPAIKGISRRYRVRHPAAAAEERVDDSLNDTYPASDPPASRFVDIPSNRRD
jgi:hypothetical protein